MNWLIVGDLFTDWQVCFSKAVSSAYSNVKEMENRAQVAGQKTLLQKALAISDLRAPTERNCLLIHSLKT